MEKIFKINVANEANVLVAIGEKLQEIADIWNNTQKLERPKELVIKVTGLKKKGGTANFTIYLTESSIWYEVDGATEAELASRCNNPAFVEVGYFDYKVFPNQLIRIAKKALAEVGMLMSKHLKATIAGITVAYEGENEGFMVADFASYQTESAIRKILNELDGTLKVGLTPTTYLKVYDGDINSYWDYGVTLFVNGVEDETWDIGDCMDGEGLGEILYGETSILSTMATAVTERIVELEKEAA